MSFIPEAAIAKVQQYKQRIVFKNGSVIKCVGSDSLPILEVAG